MMSPSNKCMLLFVACAFPLNIKAVSVRGGLEDFSDQVDLANKHHHHHHHHNDGLKCKDITCTTDDDCESDDDTPDVIELFDQLIEHDKIILGDEKCKKCNTEKGVCKPKKVCPVKGCNEDLDCTPDDDYMTFLLEEVVDFEDHYKNCTVCTEGHCKPEHDDKPSRHHKHHKKCKKCKEDEDCKENFYFMTGMDDLDQFHLNKDKKCCNGEKCEEMKKRKKCKKCKEDEDCKENFYFMTGMDDLDQFHLNKDKKCCNGEKCEEVKKRKKCKKCKEDEDCKKENFYFMMGMDDLDQFHLNKDKKCCNGEKCEEKKEYYE